MPASFAKEITRIGKELRSVRGAWLFVFGSLLAFAYFGALALGSNWVYLSARDADAVGMLIWLTGAALIAAQAFSLDYQERTLLLQLSQPISRGRVWIERFAAVLLAQGGLAAAFLLCFGARYHFQPDEAGLAHGDAGIVAFVVVSAAAFWSGVTRTTIGTFTFAGATGYATFLVAIMLNLDGTGWSRVAVGTGLALAVAAYWRFTRNDAIERAPSRGSMADDAQRPGNYVSLPVARRWATWNYLAKEIRFQRTSFVLLLLLGGVLAVLDAGLLSGLVTLHPEDSAAAFAVPHIFVAVLLAIVCGSSSICEEQRLGTTILDLALPRRRLLLFAGRFVVSGAVFATLVSVSNLLFVPSAIFGFHAPIPPGQEFLETITGFADAEGVSRFLLEPSFLLLSLFVLSFWVSTLSRNASQALLLAIPCFLTCLGATLWGLRSTYVEVPMPVNQFVFEYLPVGERSFAWAWTHSATTGGAQLIFRLAVAALVLALAFSWTNFRRGAPRLGLILVQLPLLVSAAYFLGFANTVIDRAPLRLAQFERQAWLNEMAPIDYAIGRYLESNATGRLESKYTITPQELRRYLDRSAETRVRDGDYEVVLEAALPYNGPPGGPGARYFVRITPSIPLPGNRYFLPAVDQWEIFLGRSGRPYRLPVR